MFTRNGSAVSWKSSKQETTVDSTSELENIIPSDGNYRSDLEKVVHFLTKSGP